MTSRAKGRKTCSTTVVPNLPNRLDVGVGVGRERINNLAQRPLVGSYSEFMTGASRKAVKTAVLIGIAAVAYELLRRATEVAPLGPAPRATGPGDGT